MPTIAMKMPLAPIQKDPFTVYAIKVSQATALPVQVKCCELRTSHHYLNIQTLSDYMNYLFRLNLTKLWKALTLYSNIPPLCPHLTDVNECIMNAQNCDENATCTNTDGSLYCSCNQGFSDNGTSYSHVFRLNVTNMNVTQPL